MIASLTLRASYERGWRVYAGSIASVLPMKMRASPSEESERRTPPLALARPHAEVVIKLAITCRADEV